ncbi:hypothetical protein GGS23DRAFT_584244 [Durotheca rogersii]|uniref:uncharacterized protein n=1 Tax=Durotheca rogersii TaxID=419775 RepID=UPI002220ED58|nr:uncharacterized protein GGS23DRAFT_584244 [Durotheca rogersii]KAI5859744.1 hypothetical protein GGS23DRAFT_584244 [Durotheca rogersii]
MKLVRVESDINSAKGEADTLRDTTERSDNSRQRRPGHSPAPYDSLISARSSASHYLSDNHDENIDEEAVQYLVKQSITSIISFNNYSLPVGATNRLKSQGITYDHIPVSEFYAPTLEQLNQLQDTYRSQKVTLISGGFGYGRVGTAISALQLFAGRARSDGDFRTNNVDSPDQIRVLKNLRSILLNQSL